LWAITVILLLVGLVLVFASSDSAGVVLCIAACFVIAAVIATGVYQNQKYRHNYTPPVPKWICANCGTLLTWIQMTPNKQRVCGACEQIQ
jgi:drug/metabolite transporter (DMT)-like permease